VEAARAPARLISHDGRFLPPNPLAAHENSERILSSPDHALERVDLLERPEQTRA